MSVSLRNKKQKQGIHVVKKVSITYLFLVDSLVADGAWVGFRALLLTPRKAWNAGPKPEYKTSNNRFIKPVLVMTGKKQKSTVLNTKEPITEHVVSSI